MIWYFFQAISNDKIAISESSKKKCVYSYFNDYAGAYRAAGGPVKYFKKMPDPIYAFLLKKNPFQNEFGNRDIIFQGYDMLMVSSKAMAILDQFNIHYEKSNVEIVNREKFGIIENYYWIKLLDIIDPSIDHEASELSYGVDNGKKYISQIEYFKFLENIDVDLFIPRDLLSLCRLVCSENLKNALIDNGINCINFNLVDDMIAIKEPALPYPDVLKLIPRPPKKNVLERSLLIKS